MSERINAGRLRWSLQLYRRATETGRGNTKIEAFRLLAEVKADKTDVSDGEKFRAAQVGASIETRFLIRRNPTTATIDSKDRCVCEGRHYEIVGVKDIGRRRGREITAVARTDQLKIHE